MRKYQAVLWFLILTSFFSCASNRKFVIEEPRLQLRKLEQFEIRKITSRENENPYIEPVSLIKGKLNEFIIFELKINSELPINISISGRITTTDDQKIIANLFEKDQFIEYWEIYSPRISVEDNVVIEKKKNYIQTSYIPSLEFKHKAGIKAYYIVFVGVYPPSRPAKADIIVYADNGEALVYESEL